MCTTNYNIKVMKVYGKNKNKNDLNRTFIQFTNEDIIDMQFIKCC